MDAYFDYALRNREVMFTSTMVPKGFRRLTDAFKMTFSLYVGHHHR